METNVHGVVILYRFVGMQSVYWVEQIMHIKVTADSLLMNLCIMESSKVTNIWNDGNNINMTSDVK